MKFGILVYFKFGHKMQPNFLILTYLASIKFNPLFKSCVKFHPNLRSKK